MSTEMEEERLGSRLVAAALELLEADGLPALSLRAVARRCGVSAMAPYRHFADKEALLAAVATGGYRALAGAMRQAAESAGAEQGRLRAIGLAYVRFAVEHPGLFQLIFGRHAPFGAGDAALRAAADEAFAVLRSATPRRAGGGDAGERRASLAAWSLVHGLAWLLIEGTIPAPADLDGFVEGILAQATLARE